MSDNTENKAGKNKTTIYVIVLQVAILMLSFGAVFSKFAGREEFLSFKFILFYGLLLFILFVYAIIWQQVLKNISLVVAYACKGLSVIYAMIWGKLIFKEKITWNMLLGAAVVLIGVYIFIFSEFSDKKKEESEND